MTNTAIRSACVAALLSASLIGVAGTAIAQDTNAQPLIKDSRGDTLRMTCEQAHSLCTAPAAQS